MGYWYTKLVFNLHRKITSNSFRNPIPRTNHSFFHTIKCYVTHPRSSAVQIQSENRHDRRLSSHFASGGGVTRRYYCVSHSPPEPGYRRPRWVLNFNPTNTIYVLALTCTCSSGLLYAFVDFAYPKTVTVVAMIGSAMLIDLFRRIETVPFTNRTRFIYLSHAFERMLGNIAFQQKYEGNTLPATHPQSLRTKLIATNIINGLKNKRGKAWINVAYALSDIPKYKLFVASLIILSNCFFTSFAVSGIAKLKHASGKKRFIIEKKDSDDQPLSTRAKKRTRSTSAPTIRLEMGMGCYKKLAFNLHHIVSSPVCYIRHPRCSGSGIRQDHRLSPFISGVARRYYSVDWMTGIMADYSVDWMTGIMAVIGSSVLLNIYIRIETVPFTNRSRFIFWPHSVEKLFGDTVLKEKQELLLFKRQTLPATRPESVRVRLIATNIINGLQHRSKVKKAWIDVAYASHIMESVTITWSDMLSEGLWDNEAGDVKWVQNCRKKGKWMKPTTKHMKIFNWEILLLNDCTDFTSFTLPGGKIIMSTQFLKKDTTDDEIAAILAHEIAHVLARHIAEKMTIHFWADKIEPILSLFGLEGQNGDSSKTESFLSFSRKVEVEADYIGLLLMACAGYDPRVAPEVYKKLEDIHGSDSKLDEFECRFAATSGEERARLLAEPKVMEEALLMYHEATAGRGD